VCHLHPKGVGSGVGSGPGLKNLKQQGTCQHWLIPHIYTHTKSGSQFFVLFTLEPQNSKVSFAKIMPYKLVQDRHPVVVNEKTLHTFHTSPCLIIASIIGVGHSCMCRVSTSRQRAYDLCEADSIPISMFLPLKHHGNCFIFA